MKEFIGLSPAQIADKTASFLATSALLVARNWDAVATVAEVLVLCHRLTRKRLIALIGQVVERPVGAVIDAACVRDRYNRRHEHNDHHEPLFPECSDLFGCDLSDDHADLITWE